MSYENIDPSQASERLGEGKGWTYLDVRTVEEFEAGHAPGAYNIPLLFRGPGGMEPNPHFLEQVQRAFAKDAHLVVACKAGGRSLRACDVLAAAGYEHLANMDGGYHGRPNEMGRIEVEGWAARGLPTTTEMEPGRSYGDLA